MHDQVSALTNGILRVIVVDDEPLARDRVRLVLEQMADVQIVAECADGPSAVQAIRDFGPDLVLLDVQMPGLSGLQVVETIGPDRMPAVIFVTAFDEHALRAFEVHALDYVLKPFENERLLAALALARERLATDRAGDLARRLAGLLESTASAPAGEPWLTRLHVPVRDRIRFIRVADVDWFEAASNYVRVHAGAEHYLIRATLAHLESELNPAQFVRIHRSTIVNIDRIREIEAFVAGDYIAFLTNGQKLRVSRTYRERLFDARR